ncbi:MAG TPA: sulfatase [bacterium]|nr:sulfatase [bacterium]
MIRGNDGTGPGRSRTVIILAAAALTALGMGGMNDGGPARPMSRPANPFVADPRPSVIIISIDTLRADHLGAYGYQRGTSRNIDRLARESTLFLRCYAQSSWTPSSVGSLFTSLYPEQHGSFGKDEVTLPAENVTLAEVLRGAGYQTAAFSSSPFIHPDFGFGQGFMEFGFDPAENAGNLNALVLEWLGRRTREPFFLYVMYFDPHFSYTPPASYRELFHNGPDGKPLWDPARVTRIDNLFDLNATVGRETFEYLKSEYDGEIAYADAEAGKLLQALKDAGILDRAIVVLTADHGEEFLEHGGFGHGNTLYQEVLHVPLLIMAPGFAPGAVMGETVRQIDVMPTLLEMLGVALPHPVEGRSLLGGELGGRPVFSASRHLFHEGEIWRSLSEGNLKIIVAHHPDRVELYDLAADPEEQRNLAGEDPEMLKKMTEEFIACRRAMLPSNLKSGAAVHPDRTNELLKSLGYIGK